MEAYGITGHIRGVCQRLADAGFVALAPDFSTAISSAIRI